MGDGIAGDGRRDAVPVDHGDGDKVRDGDAVRVGRNGAEGVGRAAYRSQRFRTPTRGVRLPVTAPDDVDSRLRALGLVLPSDAVLSGPTAARLWGVPIPRGLDGDGRILHVTVPADGAHLTRPGVVSTRQRLTDDETTDRLGRRVVTPERLFVELAGPLDLGNLVAVGDALLRHQLSDETRLAAAVAAWRRRRGAPVARRAVPLLDGRSESRPESRVRVIIVTAGLPCPVPNAVIRDAWGGFLARGDLVLEEWQIVIEYDGAHHDEPQQRRHDAARRTLLREHDWYVVEIVDRDLWYPGRVIAKVRGALRTRGARF